jgi:hypothetical protein
MRAIINRRVKLHPMCRSIRPLHNYDPPTTEQEIREASLQYVRKISGMTRPARANEDAFARAVEAVAAASTRLLDELVTNAPPRNRAREIERARERSIARFGERGAA